MSLLKLYDRLAKRGRQCTYARNKEDLFDAFVFPINKFVHDRVVENKRPEDLGGKADYREQYKSGRYKAYHLRGVFTRPIEVHFEFGPDYDDDQRSSLIPACKTAINASIVGQKNILFGQASHDYLHGPHICN